jgi:hypothetical protein
MIRRLFLILSIPLLCVFSGFPGAPGQSRWTQQEFILGIFWDPPLSPVQADAQRDSARFRIVRDAGFNLLTGMQREGEGIVRTSAGMRRAIDAAARNGLRYLVTDSRFFPAYEKEPDPSVAAQVAAEYRALPPALRKAMYGYNLGDEPHSTGDHKRRMAGWKRLLEQADSEKLVYMNLVGSYGPNYNFGGFRGGNGDLLLDAPEQAAYEEYLGEYIDSLNPAVASFDHYPFFSNGNVRRDYFYNLGVVRSRAKSRPLWAYPMTVDHMVYADPTEEQLRFMYFCPLAYGARGLVAFSFWGSSGDADYRSALVDVDGRPTRKFPIVKKLNTFISRFLGPVIMRVPHVAVYHASDFPDHQQMVGDTLTASSPFVAGLGDPLLLAGVFKSARAMYLLLVNKGLHPIRRVPFVLRGSIAKIAMGPRVSQFDETTVVRWTTLRGAVDRMRGLTTFIVPEMTGGEGILLRVVP